MKRLLRACGSSIGIGSKALVLPSGQVLRWWPLRHGKGHRARPVRGLGCEFYRKLRRRVWAQCRDPARIPSRAITPTPASGHTTNKMIRSMASVSKDLMAPPRLRGVTSTSG
jgi:hypothetical protein